MKATNNPFFVTGFFTAFGFCWDENFVFRGESHDFWEIVLVTEGEVEVAEDERVYVLRAGNMILHAPMEFHRIRSQTGSAPAGVIMSFHADGVLPSALKEGVFLLSTEEQERYLTAFEAIRQFVKAPSGSLYQGQRAAALLEAFLIELESRSADPTRSGSPSAQMYQRLVSQMREDVCNNLSLTELSAKCNVSVSYVKLLFQQYAGISPKAYYLYLRTRHATRLLQMGYSVTEVAEQMAFSSPNYFSAFYKKQTGRLPSQVGKL